MPRIGIFWVYRKAVMGRTVDLAEGEEGVPGLLDSPDNHADLWENDPKLLAPYPELRDREYFDVPRGRVLWRRDDATAIVYMDRTLFNDDIKVKIANFFDLATSKIEWMSDPHYTSRS